MQITRKATFRNKKTGQIKEFYPGDELGPGWDLIVMPKDRVIYINRSCSGIFESRKELIEAMIKGREKRGARQRRGI